MKLFQVKQTQLCQPYRLSIHIFLIPLFAYAHHDHQHQHSLVCYLINNAVALFYRSYTTQSFKFLCERFSFVRDFTCFSGSCSNLSIRLLMLLRIRLSPISSNCFLASLVTPILQRFIPVLAPFSPLPRVLLCQPRCPLLLGEKRPLFPHPSKSPASLPAHRSFPGACR